MLVAGLVMPAAGRTVELASGEQARLAAGSPVVRARTFESEGRRFIGGVTYLMVDAAPSRVLGALDDVGAYAKILPRTRSVRWIGMSRRGDVVVELEQGTPIAHGRYTVRVRRDRRADAGTAGTAGADTVRFWLDQRFEHDIADASGYFRVEPMGQGKTLLIYVVQVELGAGIFRRLFEEKIQAVVLSTPLLVRDYVEGK